MTVPYTFGNESSPIPLSQLDANFASIPAFANTAGNVSNAAQPNITSVGTLTSLSVSGSVATGNISTVGLVSATGNISAGNISTIGAFSAFGNITGGNINSDATIAGNIIIASNQFSTTGNINGGNVNIVGTVSTIGNVAAQGQVSAIGNIVTDGYFVGNFLGNVTGNITAAGSNTQVLFNDGGTVGAQGGFTYNKGSNTLGILGVVSAQGNITGGNLRVNGTTQFVGVVTGPTAPSGTANNQLATTAFVNSVSGALGTMSTQNANAVAITGGTIGNGILTTATISVSSISNAAIANSSVTGTNIVGGNISGGNVSGLVNPLAIADGGTGLASIAQHSLLLGNGTASLQTVAPGTSGNLLASNGTTWVSQAAPAAITGLGYGGSSWHTVTSSRSFNSLYVNSRSYPIVVSATATCAVTSTIQGYVNGVLVAWYQWQFNGCGSYGGTFIIVPPGATYQLNSGQGVYNWVELY